MKPWQHELRLTTAQDAIQLRLTEVEFQRITELIGRAPNWVELGVFSAMWSEHCSYKTSRAFLKNLPTTGPQVAVGPGENAGAVYLDDEYVAVFKMESHNHPSAIEPFQGAATGVGGILRDVFTMGARPIANLDVLFFGERHQAPTPYLKNGVVNGIAFYGNCMGIPTVGGQTSFHPQYHNNILVNAMTVGFAKKEKLFFGKAAGVGNLLVMYGNRTGPDGVHGAAMASQSFQSSSEKARPAVQVGDPFREKLVLEATLELMESGAVVGIQDMGAAGLISSSVEMAVRAGTGATLWLDRVPVRMMGEGVVVTPFERLLSESQERMLMVIEPEHLPCVQKIIEKWELPFAVVGEVVQTGRWECLFEGQSVASLPLEALTVSVPPRSTERRAPLGIQWDNPKEPLLTRPPSASWLMEELRQMLASETLASKRPIFERYDHMVGLRTLLGPGHNAAVMGFLHEDGPQLEDVTVSITAGIRSHWCEIDPYLGTGWNLVHHVQRHRAVGCRALALTDCLNFGNPENPEVLYSFDECLKGLRDASLQLDVPVVSGNVSFYNTTDGQDIPPTPSLGVVGKGSRSTVIPSFCRRAGARVYRIRTDAFPTLAGSLWAHKQQKSFRLPQIQWEKEKRLLEVLTQWQAQGTIEACRIVGDGGLMGALFQLLISDDSFLAPVVLGCRLDEGLKKQLLRPSYETCAWFFGEIGGGFLVASRQPPDDFQDVVVDDIGQVIEDPVIQLDHTEQDLSVWAERYWKELRQNG